jgi:hypothetical protein
MSIKIPAPKRMALGRDAYTILHKAMTEAGGYGSAEGPIPNCVTSLYEFYIGYLLHLIALVSVD